MLDGNDYCGYEQLYIFSWCLGSAINSDQNREKMEFGVPACLSVAIEVPSIRSEVVLWNKS